METKILEFILLIDSALKLAQQQGIEAQSEGLNQVIRVLQTLKNQAVEGQLEASQGVSTLGLSREVADWIEPLDSPLLKAVGAIEQYYQKYF